MDGIQKKQVVGILIFLLLSISVVMLYRFLMLKKTNETYAVFIEYTTSPTIAEKYFLFKADDGVVYRSSVSYNDFLNLGDTVWIKYSISDPSVIEVLDKDYKKYMENK